MKRIVAVLALLAGCDKGAEAAEKAPDAPLPAPVTAPAVAPVVAHGISWFEDAPEAAQARAQAEGKAVVVDLWAPWCHTCLSMKNFVLVRENVGALADQFVFLSINTERAENAPLLQKLPIEAWPTFFVADPKDWAVRGRWVGAATPGQFGDFLRDGQRTFDAARAGQGERSDALGLLVRGDELAAQQKYEEAAHLYEEAVKLGGDSFTRKGDALVSQIASLRRAGDDAGCVALGLLRMNDTGASVSAADFASYTLSCSEALPEGDARTKQAFSAVAMRLTPLCESDTGDLSPDDRSDACATLASAREGLGDGAGKTRAYERRLAILERASQGVPDDVAITYDWARAESLIELGRGAEALTFLSAREKAVPDNYNPPHYLARVYKTLGKWDEGRAALARAKERAYGPRRISMLGLEADLLLGAGKKDEARAAVQAELDAYRALPDGQKQPRAEQAVAARLATMR